MVQREVTAKAPKLEKEATVVVNYADSVEEAVEMFGEEAILSNAFANWRVTLQANIRKSLESGMEPEDVQTKLADAKMGVASTGGRVDPQAAFIAKFKTSSPEEQAAMLDKLREAAA